MTDLDALTAAAFTGDVAAVAALADWLAERLPAVGLRELASSNTRLMVCPSRHQPGAMWVCVDLPRSPLRNQSRMVPRDGFAETFQGWFLRLVGVSEPA